MVLLAFRPLRKLLKRLLAEPMKVAHREAGDELIQWSLQFCDADDFDAEGIVETGPCAGMPAALVKQSLSVALGYRKVYAQVRCTWADDDQHAWKRLRSWWQEVDDEKWGIDRPRIAPTQRPPETVEEELSFPEIQNVVQLGAKCSSAPELIDDSDDDWGDWKGSASSAPKSQASASSSGAQGSRDVRSTNDGKEKRPLRSPSRSPRRVAKLQEGAVSSAPLTPPVAPRNRQARSKPSSELIELSDDSDRESSFCEAWEPAPAGSGSFMWDFAAGKPEPHIRRSRGRGPVESAQSGRQQPWQDMFKAGLLKSLNPSQRVDPNQAMKTFLAWLRRRPDLLQKLSHHKLLSNDALERAELGMTEVGRWYWFPLLDKRCPFSEPAPEAYRYGVHGTSLYCLRRSLLQGELNVGLSKNMQNDAVVKGVFYHIFRRGHLCQMTYMHYISLASDGWFFAPLLVLCAKEWEEDQRRTKLKRKVPQQITYPGSHELLGFLLHVVHYEEVQNHGDRSLWFNVEPQWHKVLELDTTSSWEQLLELSRSLRNGGLSVKA